MPELPEVENVRRDLNSSLEGLVFRDVKIHRLDVIKSPRRDARKRVSSLLVGGTATGFHRHGKRLALEVDDGRVLEFSLGMSGQMIIETEERESNWTHAHLIWTLESPSSGDSHRLIWRDPRRFGGVWAWPDFETMFARKWSQIGCDALNMKYESFRDRIKKTRRSIKTALSRAHASGR